MVGCLVLPYFYTEAEMQRRPHPGASSRASSRASLSGRPVAIHARGRVSALSPEAEEAGLRPDMSLSQARAVCPGAEFLPYDEDLYRAAQGRALDLCATYVSTIEPLSPHEIFLGLTGAGDPPRITAEIAGALRAQAGFTCQTGVGPTKLVARIAALKRPGTVVPRGQEARFLAPLPLSRLWLLDEGTIEHLEALGITTIGLLQQTPITHLVERFGRMGRRLSELAFGVDRSPVRACYPSPVVEARLALAGGVEEMTVLESALRRLASDPLRSRRGGL